MSKRRHSKKGRNPNKEKKMTPKPAVVQETNEEELVETNQLFTNVNNLLQPSTISTDKVELIELPKDSVLPTGLRSIDLFILPDVLSLLTCPNCLKTNTQASRH